MNKKNLSATVIIPTNKTNEIIFEIIPKVIQQNYKNKELIFVWDNPDEKDFIKRISKKFGKKIRILKNKRNSGLAESMNNGIKNSRGDIIVILLDDCVPISRTWLTKLIEPFSDEKVVGVGSKIYEFPDETWKDVPDIGKELLWHEKDLAKTTKRFDTKILDEKSAAYRKSALEKVGLFDSHHFRTAGEDIDITMKMESQGKIIPAVESYVKHFHPLSSEEDIYWKWAQYAKSAGVLFRVYGFRVKRAKGSILRLLFPIWAIAKSMQKKKTDIKRTKLIYFYFKLNLLYISNFLKGYIKGKQ